MKKLKSKSSKLKALKANIKIRVSGFGWNEFHTPWSRNGKELSVQQLMSHLMKIIRAQKKRKIPKNPPILLPGRKVLPVLGTKVPELEKIESKESEKK